MMNRLWHAMKIVLLRRQLAWYVKAYFSEKIWKNINLSSAEFTHYVYSAIKCFFVNSVAFKGIFAHPLKNTLCLLKWCHCSIFMPSVQLHSSHLYIFFSCTYNIYNPFVHTLQSSFVNIYMISIKSKYVLWWLLVSSNKLKSTSWELETTLTLVCIWVSNCYSKDDTISLCSLFFNKAL